ncbi:acyl-CoA dehydrogenase [Streptomyces triticagri]|uniref:Acyl-CoA dehydrogenase n=1 Tax=Streptomyces triticagri TaxID=2293568 RepID=A0A372LYT3_9ACTN|nr:acyl-CoA dehydrogenase [Streptomyces triticagri]RFU83413.1 acyl-CoA dehydrogenase [Streptomyces triticagri]
MSATPDEITDLFTGELSATVRRMGDGPVAGGAPPEELVQAREAVWEMLGDLGLLHRVTDGTETPQELVEIAELMGRSLYRSLYQDTAAAAELIAAHGTAPAHRGLLDAIADGSAAVALAPRSAGTDDPAVPGALRLSDASGVLRVSGSRRFVPAAHEAELLLVVGTVPDGIALALVPADEPGVTLRRQYEISRGDFHAVELTEVPVLGGRLLTTPAQAVTAWRRTVARTRVRQAASLTGLAQGALDLAVERVKQRAQFDQPLARHQTVAFTLAALSARITAVRVLVEETAHTLVQRPDDELAACQSLFLAAELARDCAAQSLHLHGAHGMTEDADIQLFFRRAAVEALLWGTPAQLRASAADLL